MIEYQVSAVKASGSQDPNFPDNVKDNLSSTRWSNLGVDSWIQLDLGGEKMPVRSVGIGWFRGDERTNNFVIRAGTDEANLPDVITDGKSSGTTASLERYDFPADITARFVRVVVNGNTENNWASIHTLKVFSEKLVVDGGVNDRFGHKMIYATVDGGQEYFIRENNLDDDPRVKKGGDVDSIEGNNEDGYTVDDNGKVRINFCTIDSDEYDGGDDNEPPSFEHPDLADRGFMFKESDWKNCEFTVYIKPENIIDEDNPNKQDNDMTLGLRTGKHTDGKRGTCEGFSYKVRLNTKKRAWQFRKEQWHHSGYAGRNWSNNDSIGSMEDRWIGYKFIIYGIDDDQHVKTELWLDENNNNNWDRKATNKDTGDWVEDGNNSIGKRDCDASEDQIGTWGGPWALLRWDGPRVRFRDVVVREIDPSRPLP
jgi:F5/8 type C domain